MMKCNLISLGPSIERVGYQVSGGYEIKRVIEVTFSMVACACSPVSASCVSTLLCSRPQPLVNHVRALRSSVLMTVGFRTIERLRMFFLANYPGLFCMLLDFGVHTFVFFYLRRQWLYICLYIGHKK